MLTVFAVPFNIHIPPQMGQRSSSAVGYYSTTAPLIVETVGGSFSFAHRETQQRKQHNKHPITGFCFRFYLTVLFIDIFVKYFSSRLSRTGFAAGLPAATDENGPHLPLFRLSRQVRKHLTLGGICQFSNICFFKKTHGAEEGCVTFSRGIIDLRVSRGSFLSVPQFLPTGQRHAEDLSHLSPTVFSTKERFNVGQYFHWPAIKVRQIKTTK